MSLFKEDKAAAFTGLIGGAIFVFITCYAIVVWTNSLFEGHAPAGAPAGAPAAAPATGH